MINDPRRFAIPMGLAAMAVLFPATAHAASPEPTKFSPPPETVIDDDFCGTGETVTITTTVKGVDFNDPHQGEFASVFQGKQTFTSVGGTTVVGHFAGRFTNTVVAGEEEGVHTHAFTNIGLPEQFRTKGGGLITLDAGSITFLVTFDGDEELDVDVVQSGPHPQADSDFTLFCEVIPEALGIAVD